MKINIKVFYKLIRSYLVAIARHAQSAQNNKFVTFLQYLKKKGRDEVDFLHRDKHDTFPISWYYQFWVMPTKVPKIAKITSFQNLSDISRKKWGMKFMLIFVQINIKVFYKLILSYLIGWPGLPKLLKIASMKYLCSISRKKRVMKLFFFHAGKHQRFLQVDLFSWV